MSTRDVVLVGAGLVVGYLLVGYLNKSKNNTQLTTGGNLPVIDQAKIDKCNEEVALKLQTVKIANPEALEAFKKEVFENCMAKA
jgi:hypothetical protein